MFPTIVSTVDEAGVNGGRHLLGHLSLVGGLHACSSASLVLVGSQLNALLGTRIHVPDRFTVRCGQLIEFVDPVLDGLHMPPYVPLAGKWVQDEPAKPGSSPSQKSWLVRGLRLFFGGGRQGCEAGVV